MHHDSDTVPSFFLLTNHGQVLVAVAEKPDVRIREIADRVGITERATQTILNDLVGAGYVERTRVGRRNTYTVDPEKPFPHPALHQPVGSLLSGLVAWKTPEQGESPDAGLPPPPAADSHHGLDRLTALAGWLLHAPISFISLVSDETEVIASAVGVPDQLLGRELPLDQTICRHVVASRAPLVIVDAEADPLVRDNLAVTTYGLRAYAGLALRRGDGTAIGSLCVADTRPRRWTETDVRMLSSVAAAAESQVETGVIGQRHRDAAQRYRLLLDSLPETVILVFDRDLRVQVASGSAILRNGHRPEQLVGRSLDEIADPGNVAALRAHYQAGLAGDRHEFVNHGADGVTYSIDVVPLPDHDGVVQAVMAVGREHLAYGRDDHWDAHRLRALIENLPGAVYRCAVSSDWRMHFISNQIEQITGYPATDFIDNAEREFASIIHPEDRATVERAVSEAIEHDQPFLIEYRIVHRDGGTRHVWERGRAVQSADGTAFLDGAIFEILRQHRSLRSA
jgi:PAS domain S-box-containing protein